MAATHTYHDLKALTVAELREIAKNLTHEAVQGSSQMNKERLLPAICRALEIDMVEHHEVTGIDKADVKARMRELKGERAAALDAGDHERLHRVRRQLHRLNHQLRSHMR